MKKVMVSVILGIFLIGTGQEALAMEDLSNKNFETSESSTRAALKLWFKNTPPLKYNGKFRINYYPYDGGYIGVYL